MFRAILKGVRVVAACAVMSVGIGGIANAATIFFGENSNPTPDGTVSGDPVTARNDFLSNLVDVGTENFESLADGPLPVNLTFPGSAGGITATLKGENMFITDNPTGERFATSGAKLVQGAGDFEITFSQEIAAFGFFATDVGDTGGSLSLETSNGSVHSFLVPHSLLSPTGSLLFWGIIDTANTFTKVKFSNSSPFTDVFGFDDFTIGNVAQSAVPLPPGIALFASGLGLMGLLGWRRRKQAA